jgi:hypothetical protein
MKFSKKTMLITALALVVAVGLLYLAIPSDKKVAFVQADIAKDHSRFTPTESVDVAMAMKMVLHEPAHMLNPPDDQPALLLYPPTAEELAKLSGE